MGKRRSKKKQRMKIIRSVITLCIVILLGLLSFLFKPWENNDQPKDIGSTNNLDPDQLQVHYIDVGQADSILIRVPSENGMKNMLIDAGAPLRESSKDKVVTDYLAEYGISTLHYMVITHPHFDHASAAAEVIEAVTVENLILPECEATQAVRKATVPVLLLHGEADDFVPCPMSTEIAACCASPVTVHTFPDAGHGLSYLVAPEQYLNELRVFFESYG